MYSRSLYAFRRNQRIALVPADTYPTPTVTACSPATVSTLGGDTVTATGTGFMTSWLLATVEAVYFGNALAPSFTVVSATSLTAVTPAHAVGAVPVIVKTMGGQGLKADGVTYAIVGSSLTTEGANVLTTEASDTITTES